MNYDICDPSIRCGADKVGATIFLTYPANGRAFRVLAYSQTDADRLAREYSEKEKPASEEPSLFDGF